MKLTDIQLKELIDKGFTKVPQLRVDKELIQKLQTSIGEKTYSSGTVLNKMYLETFDFTSLKLQLSVLAEEKLRKNISLNDVYTVTRVLKSYDNLESYRGHFDSHLFTLVTPVIMPKSETEESGQLIVFPKIRSEPKNELQNILGKIFFRIFFFGKSGFNRLMTKRNYIELDFSDNNPVLFLGRQSYHGNRSFEKAPNGLRLTLLTHLYDPSQNGIGAILRKIRNR